MTLLRHGNTATIVILSLFIIFFTFSVFTDNSLGDKFYAAILGTFMVFLYLAIVIYCLHKSSARLAKNLIDRHTSLFQVTGSLMLLIPLLFLIYSLVTSFTDSVEPWRMIVGIPILTLLAIHCFYGLILIVRVSNNSTI